MKGRNQVKRRGTGPAWLLAAAFLLLAAIPAAAQPHRSGVVNGWAQAGAGDDRWGSASVAFGGHVYVIGGAREQNMPLAEVRRGTSGADGAALDWQLLPQPLPIPVYYHAAAIWGRDLYVIGGWDGAKRRSEVWRSQVLPDGGLAPWTLEATYPFRLVSHTAAASNGYLYVAGGDAIAGDGAVEALNKVFYAAIRSDGGLGPWTETRPLPEVTELYRHSMVAAGGWLYVSGGSEKGIAQSRAYYAHIQPGGGLGAWTSVSLPGARKDHQSLVYNGHLLLIGGRDGQSNPLQSIATAKIAADGGLEPWTTAGLEPAVPAKLYSFSAAQVTAGGRRYLWLVGGMRPGGGSAVYRSLLPDLSIRLQQTAENEWLRYTIVAANASAVAAQAVVVQNSAPDGAEIVLPPEPPPATVGPPMTWGYPSLHPRADVRITYAVTPATSLTSPGAMVTWRDCAEAGCQSFVRHTGPIYWPAHDMWLPLLRQP